MNKTFFIVALSLLSSTLSKADLPEDLKPLAAELIEKIPTDTKLAVLPLELNDRRKTELGVFVGNILGAVINNESDGKITAYERNQLETILQERDLTFDDLYSVEKEKLEKLKGVDSILTGTITKLGDNYNLLIKVIEISTGKQVATAYFTLKNDEGYEELYRTILTGGQLGAVTSTKTAKQLSDSYSVDVKNVRAQLDSLIVTEQFYSTITISVENLDSKNIHLACISTPGPSLSDDVGNSWQSNYAKVEGIQYIITKKGDLPTDPSQYTSLEPGNSIVLHIKIPPSSHTTKIGDSFSSTTYFAILEGEKAQAFPISYRKVSYPQD